MTKILFVCHGNICRSTMAEFIMKHLVKEAGLSSKFYIDSAATSTDALGCDVHHGTRAKLASEKIPCGHHIARQITKNDYENFDMIIIMDQNNLQNLKFTLGETLCQDKNSKIHKLLEFADDEYTHFAKTDIADPWYTGNFDEAFDDIMAGCKGLLKTLCE